jgi:enoyl-CoA hydratase
MIRMSYETLLVEELDSILHVSVNRPDKLNALNETVLRELLSVFADLKMGNDDFRYRGVMLTGQGEKAFIAGADIAAMSTMTAEQAEEFASLGQSVTLAMEQCTIPIVACVHGFALGGGMEMAMSADLIYATEKAIFGQPEINLALIPGFGGTQRLMRYVGINRSRELIYTGRNIKAQEAHALGLVQELFVDQEAMLEGVKKFFQQIKQKSPLILAHCKAVIRDGEAMGREDGLAIERQAFGEIFSTQDKSEGLAAFLEKRPAVFKGQ